MRAHGCFLATVLTLAGITATRAEVIVNAIPVSERELAHAAAVIGTRPLDGNWWYDARSGAFGSAGGPMLGVLPPGLALGGPLRADASGGGDGRFGAVFINGRELHPHDIAGLQALIGQVIPGRYWVDAAGNFGIEGGAALGNLHALAAASGRSGQALRGSTPSTCGSDPACRNARSWLGSNSFSDGKTGCIVMDGEVTC